MVPTQHPARGMVVDMLMTWAATAAQAVALTAMGASRLQTGLQLRVCLGRQTLRSQHQQQPTWTMHHLATWLSRRQPTRLSHPSTPQCPWGPRCHRPCSQRRPTWPVPCSKQHSATGQQQQQQQPAPTSRGSCQQRAAEATPSAATPMRRHPWMWSMREG